MTTTTHRSSDRSAQRNRRAGGRSCDGYLAGKSAEATRRAFAEADADYAHFVETGRHVLPTYRTTEDLFASWK